MPHFIHYLLIALVLYATIVSYRQVQVAEKTRAELLKCIQQSEFSDVFTRKPSNEINGLPTKSDEDGTNVATGQWSGGQADALNRQESDNMWGEKADVKENRSTKLEPSNSGMYNYFRLYLLCSSFLQALIQCNVVQIIMAILHLKK